MVNDVHVTMKARAEAQINSLRDKAEKDMHALEVRIEAAKGDAMDQMTTIAAEVASEAAAKIIGTPADLDHAKSVVQSINKREAA
jgi:F0F1-type ATP synthase membrane subunit b/b'